MIYGYCRATTSKQLQNDFLTQQSNQIRDRYFEADIAFEDGYDISISNKLDEIKKKLRDEDIIVVTSLDRVAKSISDALSFIDDIKRRGAYLHVLNIGVFDDSLLGEVLYNTIFSLDEFEKSIVVDRIQTGKTKAKKVEGFKEGRPKKYTDEQLREAIDLLNSYSYKKVEEMTGISKSTLIRAKKEMDK